MYQAKKNIFEPDPFEDLPRHIKIRPRISGRTRITGNETQVGLIFGPDPAEDRIRDSPHVKQTLPRRYKSRLVPQVSTSVLHTYAN